MKPWEKCKIYEQRYYHFLRWRNDQNKSCTSWWVVQLSCSWLFYMNSFAILKCCLNLPFLIFKIWMVQTESHEKFFKIKVVDLVEIYNFYVLDFFIWHHLVFENLVWTCYFFEIKILNCTNKVTWKVFQNKSYRSWWVL